MIWGILLGLLTKCQARILHFKMIKQFYSSRVLTYYLQGEYDRFLMNISLKEKTKVIDRVKHIISLTHQFILYMWLKCIWYACICICILNTCVCVFIFVCVFYFYSEATAQQSFFGVNSHYVWADLQMIFIFFIEVNFLHYFYTMDIFHQKNI